jgi:hypothetical protein
LLQLSRQRDLQVERGAHLLGELFALKCNVFSRRTLVAFVISGELVEYQSKDQEKTVTFWSTGIRLRRGWNLNGLEEYSELIQPG